MAEREGIDVDPEVARFLHNLREEDVALLKASINFMRSAQTMGRFVKWMVITAVGAFLGAIALGEGIAKFWHWIRGV